MEYKRILTMQDISCVGQCSMTVALPVLSACGVETCVLPTEILSTHTGGFWKPAVYHLDDKLEPILHHWRDSGIRFDGIYTGYLGSVEAIEAAQNLISQLLSPGGTVIVDPAMADHGKLYSGLDKRYAAYMKALCEQADVIIPNLTEAAMLTGMPYREQPDPEDISQMLSRMPEQTVVLTGVGYQTGETGVVVRHGGDTVPYTHPKIEGNFSGTGDLFAASFTGSLFRGKSVFEAAKIAADFTCHAIRLTREAPAHWYGVKFERALPDLIRNFQP